MTDSSQPWESIFAGRQAELAQMQSAWEQAKAGKPQILVWMAETGVGKTRLVQHFYSWLNQHADPDDYWPNTLEMTGNSLRVNPTFTSGQSKAPIPWLWWGLRATDPTGRNQKVSSCALLEALPDLQPHIEHVYLRREKKELNLAASQGMAKALIALTPLAPAVAIFDLLEAGGIWSKEKKHLEIAALSIDELKERKQKDAADTVFVYLKTVLERRNDEVASVPMVLLLDDAQWLDELTLEFVDKLLKAAFSNNWPLLLVATHWHGEWNKAIQDSDTDSFSRIVQRIQPGFTPTELNKLPDNDLSKVLAVALPGISHEHSRKILHRVDGNPAFLDDLLHELLRESDNFTASGTLSEDGEAQLKQLMSFNHIELLERRFKQFSQEVRNLLGRCSYTGMRFVEPLILAVCAHESEPTRDWKPDMQSACVTHAVVTEISQFSREFRQRGMYEIANKSLESKPAAAKQFRSSLLVVLTEWFEHKIINTYPPPEKQALLELLSHVLEEQKQSSKLLAQAWDQLIEHLFKFGKGRQAAEVAVRLVGAMPGSGWPLDWLDFNRQNSIALALQYFSKNAEVIRLYGGLIEQIKLSNDTSPERRFYLATAYMHLGLELKNQNRHNEAFADYGRAIKLMEALHIELSEQFPLAWRNDLATIYVRRGVVLEHQSRYEEAFADYGRAIELMRALHIDQTEQFQLEWCINLPTAYMNRGLLFFSQNRYDEAFADYGRAIELMEVLYSGLAEQFPPLWRKDFSMLYMNRGLLFFSQNRYDEALADYGQCIEMMVVLRSELAEQFPPAWTNHLSLAYMNRGVLFAERNRYDEALADYGQAIEMRETLHIELAERFQPTWINDLAKAYLNRGNLFCDQYLYDKAFADYGRAIKLMEALHIELSEQFPLAWRNDLAMAYMNRGVLFAERNRYDEALADYGQAIEMRETLRSELAERFPPVWCYDLAMAYCNTGFLLVLMCKTEHAVVYVGQARKISFELFEQFGDRMPDQWKRLLQRSSQKYQELTALQAD